MEAMDLLLLTKVGGGMWRFGRSPYHGGIFLTDEISGTQTVKARRKQGNTKHGATDSGVGCGRKIGVCLG